jgi:hypothetical protein
MVLPAEGFLAGEEAPRAKGPRASRPEAGHREDLVEHAVRPSTEDTARRSKPRGALPVADQGARGSGGQASRTQQTDAFDTQGSPGPPGRGPDIQPRPAGLDHDLLMDTLCNAVHEVLHRGLRHAVEQRAISDRSKGSERELVANISGQLAAAWPQARYLQVGLEPREQRGTGVVRPLDRNNRCTCQLERGTERNVHVALNTMAPQVEPHFGRQLRPRPPGCLVRRRATHSLGAVRSASITSCGECSSSAKCRRNILATSGDQRLRGPGGHGQIGSPVGELGGPPHPMTRASP